MLSEVAHVGKAKDADTVEKASEPEPEQEKALEKARALVALIVTPVGAFDPKNRKALSLKNPCLLTHGSSIWPCYAVSVCCFA